MNRSTALVFAMALIGLSLAVPQSTRVVTTVDYDRAVKMLAPEPR